MDTSSYNDYVTISVEYDKKARWGRRLLKRVSQAALAGAATVAAAGLGSVFSGVAVAKAAACLGGGFAPISLVGPGKEEMLFPAAVIGVPITLVSSLVVGAPHIPVKHALYSFKGRKSRYLLENHG